MQVEIYPNLWIGDQAACVEGTETLAVVHACKSPCHQRYSAIAAVCRQAIPSISRVRIRRMLGGLIGAEVPTGDADEGAEA